MQIKVKLKLTAEVILDDIKAYRARIEAAEKHLSTIPKRAANKKEKKKLQARRKALEEEKSHCYKLISMAKEALESVN